MNSVLPLPQDSFPVREGIAERLAAMIQVPTVYADRETRGPGPFAEFAQLLARLYPLVHQRLEFERIGQLGLVFHAAPAEPSAAAPVVLMAHYDVVPATGQEDRWSHPPFAGRIADQRVHGRGAVDDKGALCALLEAVENLLAVGWMPAREVWLCLGGDEEVTGESAKLIAATLRDRGVRPWFVLDEGGAVTTLPLPGLSGWYAMVGLAEKGVMAVELSADGEAGHASTPSGLTAVGRIAKAVARLNRNRFRPHTPRTVTQLLAAVAEHARPPFGQVYRLASRTGWLTARLLPAAGPDAAALVRTTVAPTMLAGGTSANVLPASASAVLNIRVALGGTTTGVLARLRRVIADPTVRLRVLEADEPSAESPVGNQPWRLIAEAVQAGYPGVPCVPFLDTGATDGRHWHRFCPNVYRFAPLLMSGAQRAAMHGVDENVDIEALVRGERTFRALLLALPGPGGRDD